MDHHFGYVIGDLVANVLLGALVGLLCWLIVGPSWNMWIAMFLMMAVGSFVGLVGFFFTARGALAVVGPGRRGPRRGVRRLAVLVPLALVSVHCRCRRLVRGKLCR